METKRARRWPQVLGAVLLASALPAAAADGDVHYADIDTFTGDVTSLTGTLNGNAFTLTILNGTAPDPVTNFAARASSSRFDDGAGAFSDGSVYTPALSGTDLLGMVMFSGTTDPAGMATLRLSFTDPVTDLHLHVGGLDRAGLDFAATGTATLLSGTADLTLAGTTLYDVDPGTTNERGSVKISGTASVFDIGLYEVANLDDGFQIQVSVTESTDSVPLFGPFGLAALAAGLAGAGGSALRRREP